MATSIFNNKSVEPNDEMLLKELGDSKIYLDEITAFIEKEYGDLSREWKYYGNKSGWLLKLYSKKRNVVFVIPARSCFQVSFTFGEKASQEIMQHELPGFDKQVLLDARKYAEGRTFLYEVKTKKDCQNVFFFIKAKMRN